METYVFDKYKNLCYKYKKGFIAINFIKKPPINITNLKGENFISDTLSVIPQKYLLALINNKLTKELLLELDYTHLLRLATHPLAKNLILSLFDVRGIPFKSKIKDKEIKLDKHQIEALQWMKNRESITRNVFYTDHRSVKGGILSLKQGLGKTLTSIVYTLMSPKEEFPTLVVGSKTVIGVWYSEIKIFFGSNIKILFFHKDFLGNNLNKITRDDMLQYDIIITSYDLCLSACKDGKYAEECCERGDEHSLQNGKIVSIHVRTLEQVKACNKKLKGKHLIYCIPWNRVFCDESQRFCNPKTKTYKAIMSIYGKYKWCLSGTPIKNYKTDIWAQLRFCGYSGVEQATLWLKSAYYKMKEDKLTECILSMDYNDAKIILPPKYEHDIYIELEGEEKKVYDYIIGKTKEYYDKMIEKLCSYACILALFTRLRQCCIAPYTLTPESKREKITNKKADEEAMNILKNMEDISLGKFIHNKKGKAGIYSVKISKIIEILKSIPQNEKIIIFSKFVACLDLLYDAIEQRFSEFKCIQIDGSTTGSERMDFLNQFRNNPNIRGCLMSYTVGGEGITVIEANHCLCIEPWWTDAVHNQAKSRCWRKGQTKNVHIHNIYIQNSIEERIIEICRDKNEMASSLLEGTDKPMGKIRGLDKYTLGKILGAI